MRSVLVLLAAVGILIGATLAIRSFTPPASSDAMELGAEGGGTTATPTVDAEIEHSGTVGEGTWTVSAVAPAVADPEPSDASAVVRTYAVRVEDGIDIDADETAGTIAAILTDERGWQELDGVVFQQVEDPESAEFTISLASPPTVDALCAPAQTGGTWNCRIGDDVVLNSDRWLLMTPTFDDLDEYRAYMVNHEVGHFLGHDHATCPGEGATAPVMLQQSMALDGCIANGWPALEG